MQERWIGKDVDLKILCNKIREFLGNKGVEAQKFETDEKVGLVGVAREVEAEKVKISITGSPKDFVVNFESPVFDDFSKFSAQFLAFFGLGFLVYKKVKKFDYYQSLEEDFWAFLAEAVSDLTNSASSESEERKNR
jgi:hypothetical protein